MTYDQIFIGLGSNIGNRLIYLTDALSRIANLTETKIVNYSSVYETAPVGYLKQGDFLNLIAEITTNYSPELFLHNIQKIERDLGRVRNIYWGPRTIDIDILYWGKELIMTRTLQIPHPEVVNRRFVLVPLNEIAADFKTPPQFQRVDQLLENVLDESWVELYLPKEEYEIN